MGSRGFGSSLESVRRKLLMEHPSFLATATASNNTGSADVSNSSGWQYLLAALGTVLAVSLFLALVIRYKLFQWCIPSNRHALLRETDGGSQCDPSGLETGFPAHGMAGRQLEDDDGFIEDNYIQASDRERAERDAQGAGEEEEEDFDDLPFTIG